MKMVLKTPDFSDNIITAIAEFNISIAVEFKRLLIPSRQQGLRVQAGKKVKIVEDY
jgi:hypothetical protein